MCQVIFIRCAMTNEWVTSTSLGVWRFTDVSHPIYIVWNSPWMYSIISIWCLTLSWRSKFSWVTFHVSSSLVRKFLSVAQFEETSTKKSVRLKGMYISIFEFRTTFTWTKNVEKDSFHDRQFSGYCQKWVGAQWVPDVIVTPSLINGHWMCPVRLTRCGMTHGQVTFYSLRV